MSRPINLALGASIIRGSAHVDRKKTSVGAFWVGGILYTCFVVLVATFEFVHRAQSTKQVKQIIYLLKTQEKLQKRSTHVSSLMGLWCEMGEKRNGLEVMRLFVYLMVWFWCLHGYLYSCNEYVILEASFGLWTLKTRRKTEYFELKLKQTQFLLRDEFELSNIHTMFFW